MKKATLIALFAVFAVLASACEFIGTDVDVTGTLSPVPDSIPIPGPVVNETASYVDIDVGQAGVCDINATNVLGLAPGTGTVTIDSLTFDVSLAGCNSEDAIPSLADLRAPIASIENARDGYNGGLGVWVAGEDVRRGTTEFENLDHILIISKFPEDDPDNPGAIVLAVTDGPLRCWPCDDSADFLYFGIFTEGVTVESITSSIDQAIAAGEISVWEGQALQQTLDVIENLTDLGFTQVADWLLAGLIRTTDWRSGEFYDGLGDQLSDWEPGQS